MPTWDGFLLPALRVLQDGVTRQARDLYELVADEVGLTVEQREDVLTSGQLRYRNRIGWAVSLLSRAGALVRPRRGSYTITDAGRDLLGAHPDYLTENDLQQTAAWAEYTPAPRGGPAVDQPAVSE